MTPDGRTLGAVTQAASDPDAYFAERGLVLRVAERNSDPELPQKGESRESTHWADVVSARSGEVVAQSYGSGRSVDEAKTRALKRWIVEQEPSPPLPVDFRRASGSRDVRCTSVREDTPIGTAL
jgi:hypothetical protein